MTGMNNNTIAALLAGAALIATPLAAQAPLAVNDVTVSAEVSALDGTDVLAYWPDLEDDLQGLLAETLAARSADDGYTIQVTVSEIGLDGVTAIGSAGEFNTMHGSAAVYDQMGEILGNTDIALRAELGAVTVPENATVILPDTEDFYVAMLAAFAVQVDAELDQIQLRTPTDNSEGSGNAGS